MIGWLEGTVRGRVVVTEAGVGYVVTATKLPAEGEKVQLLVTTTVREDAITLYGFVTELEQELFAALTKLQGVGPSLAMSVLRDLGAEECVRAVRSKNVNAFKRVNGCGAKSAERIVTNIALPRLADAVNDDGDGVVSGYDEITDALIALGFEPGVARSSVSVARTRYGADAADEALLAGALAHARGES